MTRPKAENDDEFAVGRNRKPGDDSEDSLAVSSGGQPAVGGPSPARGPIPAPSPYAPGGVNGHPGIPAAPDEFPIPFAVSGKVPNLANPAGSSNQGGAASRKGGRSPANPPDDAGTPARNAAAKAGDPAVTADQTAAPKKKSKPLTIDPLLLQRALSNRNNAR